MKITIILFFCTLPFCATAMQQRGLLSLFLEEKKEEFYTKHSSFTRGAVLLGFAAITAAEYKKSNQVYRAGASSTLPLIYLGLGATFAGVLVYNFIGHEVAIIVEFKNTLKKLEKDIATWQELLPQLQKNQADLAKKLHAALHILETITPLVTNLGQEDSRIEKLEQEIIVIKQLVTQLAKPFHTKGYGTFEESLHDLQEASTRVFGNPCDSSTFI